MVLLFFKFQICLLSSVLDFFVSFLKDALWLLNLVLNVLAVSPI